MIDKTARIVAMIFLPVSLVVFVLVAVGTFIKWAGTAGERRRIRDLAATGREPADHSPAIEQVIRRNEALGIGRPEDKPESLHIVPEPATAEHESHDSPAVDTGRLADELVSRVVDSLSDTLEDLTRRMEAIESKSRSRRPLVTER